MLPIQSARAKLLTTFLLKPTSASNRVTSARGPGSDWKGGCPVGCVSRCGSVHNTQPGAPSSLGCNQASARTPGAQQRHGLQCFPCEDHQLKVRVKDQ